VRWGHPAPWSRIDRFSVTAILLLVGMGAMKMRIHGALGRCASREFFGERFDPLIDVPRAIRGLHDADGPRPPTNIKFQ
jgi:hypothetical protein